MENIVFGDIVWALVGIIVLFTCWNTLLHTRIDALEKKINELHHKL